MLTEKINNLFISVFHLDLRLSLVYETRAQAHINIVEFSYVARVLRNRCVFPPSAINIAYLFDKKILTQFNLKKNYIDL